MEIYARLLKIQEELKVPKNQYNRFGKYNYRSCEDILTGLKPLLIQHGLFLKLSDQVVSVGNRIYVEATAMISNGKESVEVTALAREAETKKGMDDSQITGTASSYARKYALNGLFLIDDIKDTDTDEYWNQTGDQTSKKKSGADTSYLITEKQVRLVYTKAKEYGFSDEDVHAGIKRYFQKTSVKELTKVEMDELFKKFEGAK